MKRRDIVKILEEAGFALERDVGDHTIYEKPGIPPIQVPRHREINDNTVRNIVKVTGLKQIVPHI